jgi:hypothetical protein
MSAYILTAVGVVFLTVVISFIVPEGKLNKTINFVMRLICICVLISPVKDIFNFSDNDTALIDYDYICEVYSTTQSKALKNLLYENLQVECDCVVLVEYSDGQIKETGVQVVTNFVDEEINDKIYEYLSGLGYIDINVNEKNT